MKKEVKIFDLIIIGGGVSSTFLCLSILKLDPAFNILIIEKSKKFPQKIGESIVDLTAIYVESLGIGHIIKKHAKKTGVRFLFNESNSPDLSGLSEFASPTLPGYIKGYHLDRSVFDEDLLDEVIPKGVTVFRPAEIVKTSFKNFNNELDVCLENELLSVKSKWLVDASGRSRFIANQLSWKYKNISLNTGAIMAHFKNVAPQSDWDNKKNDYWDNCSVGLREYSTTHLMRKNSWWWIIKLDDTTTSIGVVFDKNKIEFECHEEYFNETIKKDAQLSLLTKNAEKGSIRHIENVPYVSEKLFSKGIALIGESGAFIDPLISPGMEMIGQQTIWLAELLTSEKKTGRFDEAAWTRYSKTFLKAYDARLRIYSAAYDFMHSYDIFSAWLKQGNYIYFGWIVFPSIIFKKRLKYPLTFNFVERLGLNYFTKRFYSITKRRIAQNRISKIRENEITYSSVRVPKDIRFFIVPIHLLFKALWAYVKIEAKEFKFAFRK